ncbi:hypothetical protein JL101_000835 [Skermanella rosea]|uniref:hypothetical protein n=1 Tax=Skermanella rosea TaxID=1817965 RepID=UPI001933B757|nr:hypothetical protein [Skermanella rosea]UEM04019.1 hypothetical protein JL101_000835 [Skermanella rosea]
MYATLMKKPGPSTTASTAGASDRKLVWVPNVPTPVVLVELFEGWALVEDPSGQVHAVDADQVEYAEPA